MRIKAILIAAVALMSVTVLTGCDKCKETDNITICEATAAGPKQQFLTVEYTDANGTNYINSIYNLSNVRVRVSYKGLAGPFQYISEDFSDGKFGPYYYTCVPNNAQFATPYTYTYIIEKDVYGVDTFTVKFVANVDECHSFWQQLDYYKDNVIDPGMSGKEQAEFKIVE